VAVGTGVKVGGSVNVTGVRVGVDGAVGASVGADSPSPCVNGVVQRART
jgi:hypothetical protein